MFDRHVMCIQVLRTELGTLPTEGLCNGLLRALFLMHSEHSDRPTENTQDFRMLLSRAVIMVATDSSWRVQSTFCPEETAPSPHHKWSHGGGPPVIRDKTFSGARAFVR